VRIEGNGWRWRLLGALPGCSTRRQGRRADHGAEAAKKDAS
jgi:hypothetical protein